MKQAFPSSAVRPMVEELIAAMSAKAQRRPMARDNAPPEDIQEGGEERVLSGRRVVVKRRNRSRTYVVNTEGAAYRLYKDRNARYGTWRRVRWLIITGSATTAEAEGKLKTDYPEHAEETLPFGAYAKAGVITITN